jgi:alcohol dehydrogenase (cytochrome c)
VGTEGTAPRPEFNGGLMSTSGGLLFGGGSSGHLVAYDVHNGSVLWHSGLHAPVSNTPISYLLDGRQYVLVGADDSLYAFSIQADRTR